MAQKSRAVAKKKPAAKKATKPAAAKKPVAKKPAAAAKASVRPSAVKKPATKKSTPPPKPVARKSAPPPPPAAAKSAPPRSSPPAKSEPPPRRPMIAEAVEPEPRKMTPPAVATTSNGTQLRAHPFSELNSAQLISLHEKLKEEHKRLREGMQQRLNDAISDIDPLADEIDIAQRHTEQASLMRFADKEQKLLNEIEHALDKMEKTGEYGVCEGTEEAISYKRLEVRPWTRYSVAHKEQLERERKQHRR